MMDQRVKKFLAYMLLAGLLGGLLAWLLMPYMPGFLSAGIGATIALLAVQAIKYLRKDSNF